MSVTAMRLTDILKPHDIKIPLDAKTKSEAIAELVAVLAANNEITDAKKVLDAVLEREATRTTGIGNGLAIPHGWAAGDDHLDAIESAGQDWAAHSCAGAHLAADDD